MNWIPRRERKSPKPTTLYYYMQKLDKASYNFEQSALVSAEPPLSQLDTMALFNASVAARLAGDNAKAKDILNKCLSFGYDSEGKVYSALFYVTDAELAQATTAADSLALRQEAKGYLEQGIAKYPLKRYGEPEDIAHGIAYLLSDASSWVTGQSLQIPPGRSGTGYRSAAEHGVPFRRRSCR